MDLNTKHWFIDEIKGYTKEQLKATEATAKFIMEMNKPVTSDNIRERCISSIHLFEMYLNVTQYDLYHLERVLGEISILKTESTIQNVEEKGGTVEKINYTYQEEDNTYYPESLYRNEE